MMSRRHLLIRGGALFSTTALGAFAWSHRSLRLTHHVVPWRRRTSLRVAHLTDIHVGWSTPTRILDQAAAMARTAKPDLVVLTGDYVNHSLQYISRLGRFVDQLPGPVLAVLGNHDHWTNPEAIMATLTASGATVLRNDSAVVGDLTVVGVDDSVTRHHDPDRAFSAAPSGEDLLVLTHSPAIAPTLAPRPGARLILCGHTHGGQVAVPKVTRAVARRRGMPFVAGRVDLKEAELYVNAGVGHSLTGLRYGRPAKGEVAIFDLVPVLT